MTQQSHYWFIPCGVCVCVCVCVCSVTQPCLTLCNCMDCSPPGSSVHGISQARILELAAISYSRGSSQPRGRTCNSCISYISRQILYHSTMPWENHNSKIPMHPNVQFSSDAQLQPTLCDPMDCSTPGFPGHHQLLELLKLMCIELVMPSNHVILCHPLLLPSIFPSIFSNESVLHIRWPKYWSFNISSSKEHPGLISFRMDWFDHLAVQGTLKSLLQHHSSKTSIVQYSALCSNSLIHTWLLGKP